MPDSLTPQTLNTLRLPIVFTPGAWQRAAFEAHLAYPHKPYVLFEVIHIEPTDHLHHDPLLQLSLSLLQEPGQPAALLIALAGEHQR